MMLKALMHSNMLRCGIVRKVSPEMDTAIAKLTQ